MGGFRRAFMVLTAALAMGAPAYAEVPVPADNAFVVPGANFDAWAPALLEPIDPWATDGPLVPLINAQYYDCGSCAIDIVRYPRTAGPLFGPHAPFADESIAIGAGKVIDDVRSAPGSSVVSTLSLGALVSDAAQRVLDADPNRPDPTQLNFIVAGDPSRITPLTDSIGSFLPVGLRIPVLGWTVTRPPSDSPYDTVVVIAEYDLVADFPDRPWNVLADLNAIAGFFSDHSDASLTNPADVPTEYIATTVNDTGATTTTYLVPSPVVPLIRPLDRILPDRVVALANKVIKPIVDRGYSRYDSQTGNRMPYLQPTEKFPKLVKPGAAGGSATTRSQLHQQHPVSRAAASRMPARTSQHQRA